MQDVPKYHYQLQDLMSELASADLVFGTRSERAEGDQNQGLDTTCMSLLCDCNLSSGFFMRSNCHFTSNSIRASAPTTGGELAAPKETETNIHARS